jgi:competence protein ComEA
LTAHVPEVVMPEPRLPVSDREHGPDQTFWGDRTRRDGLHRPPRVERPLDRARERLQLLRGDPRAGVALLVVVAVVAGFVWYRAGSGASAGPPPPVVTSAPIASSTTEPTAGAAVDESPRGAHLFVHVAGDVAEPGVVELPAGSRVIDAVDAAGGGKADADLDRLNLAAKVADGQRILVQKVGDPPAPAEPSGAPGDPGSTTAGPLNVNTATVAQLDEALPGIGPTLAAAIVEERDRRGGFRSVNELREVRGIGEKRFADIKDKVTV